MQRFHWKLPLGLFTFFRSPLFQSILLLLIIKKTNQNLQRPSPYPTHLWVKPVKVLILLIVAIRVISFSCFCCVILPLFLVWMWLALYQKSIKADTQLCMWQTDWLTGLFLQITRGGRRGQTGLRWREAATRPWGKHLGISWPELQLYSPSTAGWTGHPNMVEIGSSERWCSFYLILDC